MMEAPRAAMDPRASLDPRASIDQPPRPSIDPHIERPSLDQPPAADMSSLMGRPEDTTLHHQNTTLQHEVMFLIFLNFKASYRKLVLCELSITHSCLLLQSKLLLLAFFLRCRHCWSNRQHFPQCQ